MNKLWILRPLKGALWDPWYDKAFGFVIRAPDEQTARAIAQKESGDEASYDKSIPAWTDPRNSSCKELTVETKGHFDDLDEAIVMRDFHSA